MALSQGFERLIRFEDDQGQVHYGDLKSDIGTDKVVGAQVTLLAGDLVAGFTKLADTKTVHKVPLPQST
jgi:hypothetical protein